jgi:hypothetical protein
MLNYVPIQGQKANHVRIRNTDFSAGSLETFLVAATNLDVKFPFFRSQEPSSELMYLC